MFLSSKLNQLITKTLTLNSLNFPQFPIFHELFPSINPNFVLPRCRFLQSFSYPQNPNRNPNPNFPNRDFYRISTALNSSNIFNALERIRFEPSSSILLQIFKRFESSPIKVLTLFKFAQKRPGFAHDPCVFNSVMSILAKSGEFKLALMELLYKIKSNDGYELISGESLGFLVKDYVRLGFIMHAIRLYKFAKILGIDMFDVLLNELCDYRHVKGDVDLVDRKVCLVATIEVCNMLLEGCFLVGDDKKAEQLMLSMRRENVVLGDATYGVLVSGYCRMGLVDRAVELLGEMRRDCVKPSRRVYDPLVSSLASAGRLKEALGMLQRFLVIEDGPTLMTYNTLVHGFCKASDLDGAGKILKMMSSRGIMPTTTTYNYFFKYFLEHGETVEAMSLYRKLIQSDFMPNERTYHLLLSLLCKEEKINLVLNIREDMRSRKHVLNLEMSDVLIHFFCKFCMFKEAVMELEECIQRGFAPKLGTCEMLCTELKNKELRKTELKVSNMVKAIPCSKPPSTVSLTHEEFQHQRENPIIRKGKTFSYILTKSLEPRKKNKICRRYLAVRK